MTQRDILDGISIDIAAYQPSPMALRRWANQRRMEAEHFALRKPDVAAAKLQQAVDLDARADALEGAQK